jgi:hypothetical protein
MPVGLQAKPASLEDHILKYLGNAVQFGWKSSKNCYQPQQTTPKTCHNPEKNENLKPSENKEPSRVLKIAGGNPSQPGPKICHDHEESEKFKPSENKESKRVLKIAGENLNQVIPKMCHEPEEIEKFKPSENSESKRVLKIQGGNHKEVANTPVTRSAGMKVIGQDNSEMKTPTATGGPPQSIQSQRQMLLKVEQNSPVTTHCRLTRSRFGKVKKYYRT